jgi:hypothetical protein
VPLAERELPASGTEQPALVAAGTNAASGSAVSGAATLLLAVAAALCLLF